MPVANVKSGWSSGDLQFTKKSDATQVARVRTSGFNYRSHIEVVTAAATLTNAESGKTVVCGAASGVTITLPTASPGLWFRCVVNSAAYTMTTTITIQGTDLARGLSMTPSAGKGVVIKGAVAYVGAGVIFESDKDNGWLVYPVDYSSALHTLYTIEA
jgi:hypothetical protein